MDMSKLSEKKRKSYAGESVFVGIDVHKSFYVVSVIHDKELVLSCRIPAEPLNVINLVGKYFPGANVQSCYEAGFSGFGLHRELVSAGIENIVVHASAVEVNARNRVKTDKRDSKKLAIHLANDRLVGIQVPSIEQENSRLLSRTRQQLVKSITRTRIQIRMKLHQFGLLDRSENRALSIAMVKTILARGVSQELKMTIEALLQSWEHMVAQQRKLEREIRLKSKRCSIQQTWMSLPGIGVLSSRILTDELGDLSQFPNQRCLFSFTGLTPSEYSSGEKVHKGKISRQGRACLRLVLVEAAWRAVRQDASLNEVFERIAARRGKKRAIVAVARKLVGRARAVFKKGGDYQVDYRQVA